jgi:hypothetical protein
MTTRATIALLGLTLALLSPAPVFADAGGTDRPLNGTLAGLVTLTPATGSITGEATGVMSHLGEVTASQAGHVGPTADGHYAGASTWSVVADNGDTLSGTAILTVDGPPAGVHTTTMDATIQAGTGRFGDASGNFTYVFHVFPVSPFNGVTLTNGLQGTGTGRITY